MALDGKPPIPLGWGELIGRAVWDLYLDFLDGDEEYAWELIVEKMAETVPAFRLVLEPSLN